jgi:two-component system, OmpR family, phosphate regulon sensor histidine kinase PhoR
MFWRLFLGYIALVVVTVLILAGFVAAQGMPYVAVELVGIGIGLIIISIVPAYLLARKYTRPLEKLARGADELSASNFRHRIEPAGSREFRTLADTFNAMSARLASNFQELERDEDQLRTILSGMIEGVLAVDEHQAILFANERVGEMLDFVSESAVGQRVDAVVKHPAIPAIVSKALSGGGPYREKLELSSPERKFTLYASPLPGTEKPGAVLVVYDVTEIRRLEQLRQDFVANVSHELKTPLSNIKSSIETLLDGAAEEPNSRLLFLTEIESQATRLDALVGDILVLARIEAGEATLDMEVVQIEDAIQDCLDRHRTRAEARGLALNGVALGNCPQDLSVWVDEEALAQILDNLVDNAIKYTQQNGRVTVRWEASDLLVAFEVQDSGIGIPPEGLGRVFERFYRVDKARSREKGGTGLGLAIVKHMVQIMKGTIRVSSVVDQGTTFRVTLPRAQKERSFPTPL